MIKEKKFFKFLSILFLMMLILSTQTDLPSAKIKVDGYATFEGGTTGGRGAMKKNIFVVTNRKEFINALKDKNGQINQEPKIIYVSGIIDLCTDDNNKPLTEKDFIVPPYSLEAYLATYSPQVWGRKKLTGELEEARKASENKQASHIKVYVGSNTTIIGKDKGAKIIHGNLVLDSVSNVIIKNITFEDAFDFFPRWDPLDSYDKTTDTGGRWNAEFDLISIINSTNVFITKCTFSDGDRPDSSLPIYFDQKYQCHDGAVDITRGSNYITISYCYFYNHDKVTLIGGSDNHTEDIGKMKVTLHHNFYEKVGQRLPRVRFGEVHVYNNYYKDIINYAIGIGINASIYAEANYFENIVEPAVQIKYFDSKGAGYIKDVGNYPPISGILDAKDGFHTGSVTWNPKERYSYKIDNAMDVKNICLAFSGADKPEREIK